MADEEIYYDDDEFIINLTIDGTSYEETEVKVTDPNKTIRDQIASIVAVFELPKLDNGGTPHHPTGRPPAPHQDSHRRLSITLNARFNE